MTRRRLALVSCAALPVGCLDGGGSSGIADVAVDGLQVTLTTKAAGMTFLGGTKPDGSAVYDQDDSFNHHWKMSDPDSLVAYVRSLAARGTPTQE